MLGSKEPFTRLQNMCDNDLYVWRGLFQQIIKTSSRQSMANTLDKSKLQNSTLEAI